MTGVEQAEEGESKQESGVQRKIIPRAFVPSPDTELIVVASLVDKPANLGGKIFGPPIPQGYVEPAKSSGSPV